MQHIHHAVVAGAFTVLAVSHAALADNGVAKAALEALRAENPSAGVLVEGPRVSRIYGSALATGVNPTDTADRLLASPPVRAILGAEPEHLLPGNRFGTETQPLMYDADTNTYRFTAVYKRHVVDGVEVFDSFATVLVTNEPLHPAVLVTSTIRSVGDFRPPAAAVNDGPGRRIAATMIRGLNEFSESRSVIWAEDGPAAGPRLAYIFTAQGFDPVSNMPLYEKFVFDAETHDLLLHRNLIFNGVEGTVTGYATDGLFPDTPSNTPVIKPLFHAYIFDESIDPADCGVEGVALTNASGVYRYEAPTDPVRLGSMMIGPWACVNTFDGSNLQIIENVSPPGFDFVHNSSPDEIGTAQVNAFRHTTIVRNFVAGINPAYPGIDFQIPVNVNLNNICNAFFDPGDMSINFFKSQSPTGCPNTAYSTVAYHEYAHYVIFMGGVWIPGAYHEGMADAMAILVTNQPDVGHDFFGPGTGPLRSGINSVTYPCAGGGHFCGQVLSGVTWNLRENLAAMFPPTPRRTLPALTINSFLLNNNGDVSPQLILDYATLDDDNGNLVDGTPHLTQIVNAFEDKGFPMPGVGHDVCDGFVAVGEGKTRFHNGLALTDGPSESTCGGDFERDVWFGTVALCDGTMTVSLCDSDFPGKLGIYISQWPGPWCPLSSGQIDYCSTSGCTDGNAEVSFGVSVGDLVLIRVGSTDNSAGFGKLAITCAPSTMLSFAGMAGCSADLNGDGVVDTLDLLDLMASWGDCPAIADEECEADLTGDRSVDLLDVLRLLDSWWCE